MPTLLAPDRQDLWQPVWLVDLTSLTSPPESGRFASIDLDVSGSPWSGRLKSPPSVEREIMDTFWGIVTSTAVSLSLSNADGALSSLYTTDPRGKSIVLKRYDRVSGTTVTEFTGTVSEVVRQSGSIEITAEVPSLEVFEVEIPKGIVDVATFGSRAVNVGSTLPVIFGNVERVPLLYVNDNTTLNQYDYLVARGTVSVNAVYRVSRNGSIFTVGPSEYTVSTTLYPGFTVIRFVLRQTNFANEFPNMYADVTGFSAERNFARAIRTLLSDTTYGLGQTVNAASFTQAEADLDAVGSLYCDATMLQARQAQDILRELLQVRGMRLAMNSSGEWTLAVDKEQTSIRIALQDGTGDGERNLLLAGSRRRPPLPNTIRNLKLRYKHDYIENAYRLEVSRTVNASLGRDQVREHPFIRDNTTADKTVHYWSQREKLGSETVEAEITQEGRKLTEGELVTLSYTPLGYTGETLEVRRIEKRLDRIAAVLGAWDSAFYTYTPGSPPTDATVPSLTDLSRDIPAVPSGLGMSSAVILDADGSLKIALDFSWNANTETDLDKYELQFRRQGDTNFTVRHIAAGTVTHREIGDVIAATPYEAKIKALDIFGNESNFSSPPATHTTVADTSAPSAPTGLTATPKPGLIELDWSDNTEADFSEYGVWRNTTNTPGTATEIAQVRASRFLDAAGLTAGTTYYYWISAYDRSENQSAKSLVASATAQGASTSDAPSNPSAPSFSSEGTFQASDGRTSAYFIYTLPALPTGASYLNALYRINGQAPWQIADQASTGGGTVRIDDLVPGQSYEVAVQAFSGGGGASSIVAAAARTAPGDTSAPSAPTSAVATAGFQLITLSWTNPTASDLALIEIWRSTSNDSSTANKIGEAKTNYFVNDKLSNGTTYYYWLKAKDLSGNASGFHAGQFSGASATTLRAATDDAQADAWSQAAYVRSDAAYTITSNSTEEIIDSVTITTVGGRVEVFFKIDFNVASGQGFKFRVRRDSAELELYQFDYITSNDRVDSFLLDAPSAGTYTYKLTGILMPAATATTVSHRRLMVVEAKK